MIRVLTACAVAIWAGSTLLLSRVSWFRRGRLADRLVRYVPGITPGALLPRITAAGSLREVVGPLALGAGDRLTRLLGVSDGLALRLERVHAPIGVGAFRTRQLGAGVVGLGLGALITVAARPPAALALLLVAGLPLLAFLLLEQQAIREARDWQRRIFLELPVVSEQLGMLLGAGFSLGAALNRLGRRGQGACATDLQRVCGRIRQGLDEADALSEWAVLADVEALTRLVNVLTLNRQGGDLGRMIAEEARTIRRDTQREVIETIARRSQQVWIPVTVATLVPGVLFLVVPFVDALQLFTSG